MAFRKAHSSAVMSAPAKFSEYVPGRSVGAIGNLAVAPRGRKGPGGGSGAHRPHPPPGVGRGSIAPPPAIVIICTPMDLHSRSRVSRKSEKKMAAGSPGPRLLGWNHELASAEDRT